MNSVFMENMPGIISSNNIRIKSSALDNTKPYKIASFTEALALAIMESNRFWNNMMIDGVRNELNSFKEGFVDDTKEKLKEFKNKLVEWIRRIWKVAVTLVTKLYAYLRTKLTTGKELFKNRLEDIRKGQKLFESGDAKEIKEITLYVFTPEYKKGIESIIDVFEKIFTLYSGIKVTSYGDYQKLSMEAKQKVLKELNISGGVNRNRIGKQIEGFISQGKLMTIFSKIFNELDDSIKYKKFGREEARTFSLSYIEEMFNLKNKVDLESKNFKKILDKAIKEAEDEVKEFDKDDETKDQYLIATKRLSLIKELVSSYNSIFIAINSNFKRFVSSASKVTKLYAQAGIVGKKDKK